MITATMAIPAKEPLQPVPIPCIIRRLPFFFNCQILVTVYESALKMVQVVLKFLWSGGQN
jgi:hypothetical protein